MKRKSNSSSSIPTRSSIGGSSSSSNGKGVVEESNKSWYEVEVVQALDELAFIFCQLTKSNLNTCHTFYEQLLTYTQHSNEVIYHVAQGYLMRLLGGYFGNSTLLLYLDSKQANQIAFKHKTWWKQQYQYLLHEYNQQMEIALDEESEKGVRKRRRLSESKESSVTSTSNTSHFSSITRNPVKQRLLHDSHCHILRIPDDTLEDGGEKVPRMYLYLNYFLAYVSQLQAERYEYRLMKDYDQVLYYYMELYEEGEGYAPAALDLALVLESELFPYPKKNKKTSSATAPTALAASTALTAMFDNELAGGDEASMEVIPTTPTMPSGGSKEAEDESEEDSEEEDPAGNREGGEDEHDFDDQFEHALNICESLIRKEYPPAMYRFAILMGRGKFVGDVDPRELLQRAAELGFEDAKSRYALLSAPLDPIDMEQAEVLIQSWKSQQDERCSIPMNWGNPYLAKFENVSDVMEVIYKQQASTLYSTVALFQEPYLIGLARRAGVRYFRTKGVYALQVAMEYCVDKIGLWIMQALLQQGQLKAAFASKVSSSSPLQVKKDISFELTEDVIHSVAKQLGVVVATSADESSSSSSSSSMASVSTTSTDSRASLYKQYLHATKWFLASPTVNDNEGPIPVKQATEHKKHYKQVTNDQYLWKIFCISLQRVKLHEENLLNTMKITLAAVNAKRWLLLNEDGKDFTVTSSNKTSFNYLLYVVFNRLDENVFRYIVSFLGYQRKSYPISRYDADCFYPVTASSASVYRVLAVTADDIKFKLHWAAMHGNLHEVQHLLQQGEVDVDLITDEYKLDIASDVDHVLYGSGFTALHFAIANGHFDVVKLLVEHNADVNIRSVACRHIVKSTNRELKENITELGLSETPLMLAVRAGHVAIVDYLLTLQAISPQDIVDVSFATVKMFCHFEQKDGNCVNYVANLPYTLTNIALLHRRMGVLNSFVANHGVYLQGLLYQMLQFVPINVPAEDEEEDGEDDEDDDDSIDKTPIVVSTAKFCLDPLLKWNPEIRHFIYRHVRYMQDSFESKHPDPSLLLSLSDVQLEVDGEEQSVINPRHFLEYYFPQQCLVIPSSPGAKSNSSRKATAAMEAPMTPIANPSTPTGTRSESKDQTENQDAHIFLPVVDCWMSIFIPTTSSNKSSKKNRLEISPNVRFVFDRIMDYTMDKIGHYTNNLLLDHHPDLLHQHQYGKDGVEVHHTRMSLENRWKVVVASVRQAVAVVLDPKEHSSEISGMLLTSRSKEQSRWQATEGLWHDTVLHYLCQSRGKDEMTWLQLDWLQNTLQESQASQHNTTKKKQNNITKKCTELIQFIANELKSWLHYLCLTFSYECKLKAINAHRDLDDVAARQAILYIDVNDVLNMLDGNVCNFFFSETLLFPSFGARIFGVDEEDDIIAQAYIKRQKDGIGFKLDSFETQRFMKPYDHCYNAQRFIVTNAAKEMQFYRNQIQQLVIGKADFQQLFTARLTHQLSQLLQQHSTNNTDTIQIHATERTWYLLQYLYEFIITRLLNRINDTYVTPWLLVAFRLFPNSFRYVRNHPMNDAQRQELQHIYAMLPLAALQEQYDVGQGNQDLSAVHIARMTLAMELEGLF